MKILKLETLNLASLEGFNVIDFEHGVLRDSQIFSIVGPTGSGKSTILDAICLPLYGRAPRYPMKRGERRRIKIIGEESEGEKNRLAPADPRNILTRGQKQGYSHLTFLANDGRIYRAEWAVVFRQKNYGAAERRLFWLDTGTDGQPVEHEHDWHDLEERILGLDFEQFLRTVLIAQGAFAGFLTADEDDRYQLLEKLMGNGGLYRRIAGEIAAGRDAAAGECSELESRCRVYLSDVLEEEPLQALHQQIADLKQHEQQLAERRKQADEQLKWFADEARQQQELVRYERDYRQAAAAREAFAPQAARLKLHDATLEAVALYREQKASEVQAERLGKKLVTLQQSIASKNTEIRQGSDALKMLQLKLQTAELELTQAKPQLNAARELRVKLDQALTVEKAKADQAAKCRRDLTQAAKAVADNEKAIQAAQTTLTKLADETADMQQGMATRQKELDSAIESAIGALRTEEQSLKVVNADELQAETMRLNDSLTALPLETLQQEVDTMTAAYTLMTSENWQQHRQHLTDGQPCPLCGATHHPYADLAVVTPVITDMQQLLEQKRAALQQRQQQRTAIQQRMARLADEHARALKAYNAQLRRIDALRKAKESVERERNTFAESSAKTLEQQRETIAKAQNALTAHQARTADLLRQRDNCQQLSDQAATGHTAAVRESQTLQAACKELFGGTHPDIVEKELTSLKTAAEQALRHQQEVIDSLNQQLSNSHGQLEALKQQLEAENARAADKQRALAEWIGRSPFALTIDTLHLLATATDDWEAIRSEQQRHDEVLTRARTTLDNHTALMAQHQQSKPADDRQTLEAHRAALDKESRQEELIRLVSTLQRHTTASQALGPMKEQLHLAHQTLNDWEQLFAAVGNREGDMLRKMVQCYTLRFLVMHANAEIRKFNQRYELVQVKNSLGLRVIDHDRANDIRDTTSLSGGETFIVSLGLALGLSALSAKGVAFANIFIDEGFGTLDPDALATVIDALSMLQTAQGKKVCVISHTDTMSERITTQIRVIKNGNSGTYRIDIVGN